MKQNLRKRKLNKEEKIHEEKKTQKNTHASVGQLTNPMVTQSVHSPRNLKSLSMPPPAAIVITVLCPSAPIRTIVVVLPLSSLSSPPPPPKPPPPPSTTVVVNEEEVSNVVEAELTAMDVVVLVSVSSCKLCRKAALTAAQ